MTSRWDDLHLVEEDQARDLPDGVDAEKVLVLKRRKMGGQRAFFAVPLDRYLNGDHTMFGGNFVWSHDSRFCQSVSDGPVHVHDRYESPETMRRMSGMD